MQTIKNYDIDVIFDKYDLLAGQSIWQQIEKYISNSNTDGFVMYLTDNSINSSACMEELDMALNKTLACRGESFPIIGIANEVIDFRKCPARLTNRLCVNTSDNDWLKRIKYSLENKPLPMEPISPDYINVSNITYNSKNCIQYEIRPRISVWHPVFFAVIPSEKNIIETYFIAPSNRKSSPPPMILHDSHTYTFPNYFITIEQCDNVSSTKSLYIITNQVPSELIYGEWDYASSKYKWARKYNLK